MPSTPAVSIVVAAWQDASGLVSCLDSLTRQGGPDTQVIVVSSFELPRDVVARYQGLEFITATDLPTPQLWARGIACSKGEIVAITTSHFTPAPDWIARIREAHARLRPAGVGGSIDPPRGGSLVAWATYFLRYSSTFRHDREQEVTDIAGDNASYDRAALEAHAASMRDGFWEPEFHRLVLAEGRKLFVVPDVRVTQRGTFTLASFCRQRLDHGRHFGSNRVLGQPRSRRIFRVVTSPLVPAVLLGKVASRVMQRGRDVGSFVACLPALVVFVLAWSVGESWGYLLPGPKESLMPARQPGGMKPDARA